jgi:hypothetical protein
MSTNPYATDMVDSAWEIIAPFFRQRNPVDDRAQQIFVRNLINLGNLHEPNAIKTALCLLAPGLQPGSLGGSKAAMPEIWQAALAA